MKWYYFVSSLLLLLVDYSSSASTIAFQATPSNILPVLTKSLELRCAVENRETSHLRSAVIGRNARSTVWPKWTTFYTSSEESPRSKTDPFTQEDVFLSNITSITISRHDNETGNLLTIASVSPYDPPTAVSDDGKITKVEGSTISSSVSSEQGYLSVVWEYPFVEQAGLYTCEVGVLDAELHPVIGTSYTEVVLTEAAVQDLVTYVADNDKYIGQLQNLTSVLRNSLSELETQLSTLQQNYQERFQELQNKMDNMKSQHVQTGSHSGCARSSFVEFPVPYKEIPKVFLSLSYYSHHNSRDSSADYVIQTTNITKTGFHMKCTGVNIHSLTTTWLAIDA